MCEILESRNEHVECVSGKVLTPFGGFFLGVMTMTDTAIKILSREPWWAAAPEDGQTEADVSWGYLELHSDGTWHFDDTRPSDDEIKNRKSCKIG